MVRRIDYMILAVNKDGEVVNLDEQPTEWDGRIFDSDVLTELGSQGWEMCDSSAIASSVEVTSSLRPSNIVVNARKFYFKRLVEKPTFSETEEWEE